MCKPKKKPAHVLVLVHFCFRFSAAGKEMKDRAAFCRVVSSLVPRGAKNNGAGSSWGNTAAMFSSARNSSPIPVYHGVGQCGCGYLKEFRECVSRLILTDSYMDSQAKCIARRMLLAPLLKRVVDSLLHRTGSKAKVEDEKR